MNPEPLRERGSDSGGATSSTSGESDCSHLFRNPSMTFHGAACERCGLSFVEWGLRREAELAAVVDWRHSD